VSQRVGVLALQGDFQKHIDAVRACGADAAEVRTPAELDACERLIIPGGESTTLGILLHSSCLDRAVTERAEGGMPMWGTCMGMIILAREIEGSDQFRLNLLDIAIRRNAFGRQVYSFEADLSVEGMDAPFRGVFIRAPIVISHSKDVRELAAYDGKTVSVIQGNRLGTSFHPELTNDLRFHRMFLDLPAS
jgi:5'-phosphate synthase pdxT subunit